MVFLINKKGGERVLSFYWMVILVLIAIGIVSGVYIFFSKPMDVRQTESILLTDKLINCFIENGVLKEVKGEIDRTCGIDMNDKTGSYNNVQYYIEVKINSNPVTIFKKGDESYRAFCGQEKSRINIPYCTKRKVMALQNGNLTLVEIIGVVGKVKQNAV
jgi:hypothetical protein